jgi:hypothetical protein
MTPTLSVADVLARLEAQVAFHQERERHHTEQESFHREQRALHAAESESLARHLEAFRAAAAPAVDLAVRQVAMRREPQALEAGERPRLIRLVERVVQGMAPEERFGPAKVRAEVERHYGAVLRDRVDVRKVSSVLRHLARRGRIHLVRRGRPRWEALYSRQEPAPAA